MLLIFSYPWTIFHACFCTWFAAHFLLFTNFNKQNWEKMSNLLIILLHFLSYRNVWSTFESSSLYMQSKLSTLLSLFILFIYFIAFHLSFLLCYYEVSWIQPLYSALWQPAVLDNLLTSMKFVLHGMGVLRINLANSRNKVVFVPACPSAFLTGILYLSSTYLSYVSNFKNSNSFCLFSVSFLLILLLFLSKLSSALCFWFSCTAPRSPLESRISALQLQLLHPTHTNTHTHMHSHSYRNSLFSWKRAKS